MVTAEQAKKIIEYEPNSPEEITQILDGSVHGLYSMPLTGYLNNSKLDAHEKITQFIDVIAFATTMDAPDGSPETRANKIKEIKEACILVIQTSTYKQTELEYIKSEFGCYGPLEDNSRELSLQAWYPSVAYILECKIAFIEKYLTLYPNNTELLTRLKEEAILLKREYLAGVDDFPYAPRRRNALPLTTSTVQSPTSPQAAQAMAVTHVSPPPTKTPSTVPLPTAAILTFSPAAAPRGLDAPRNSMCKRVMTYGCCTS